MLLMSMLVQIRINSSYLQRPKRFVGISEWRWVEYVRSGNRPWYEEFENYNLWSALFEAFDCFRLQKEPFTRNAIAIQIQDCSVNLLIAFICRLDLNFKDIVAINAYVILKSSLHIIEQPHAIIIASTFLLLVFVIRRDTNDFDTKLSFLAKWHSFKIFFI